jgi:branched-chain amino acid transport system permease protein/urea transport system permease protein
MFPIELFVLVPLQIGQRVLVAATSISALVLAAAGLTIIFGLMGVINLAHGTFVMLGAYTGFMIQNAGFSPWLGIVAAPFVVGTVGLLLEISLVKRLYERPLDTLLATWGVAIILREGVKLVFGTSQKSVSAPIEGSVSLFGTQAPVYWLFIIAISASVMAAVILLFKYTDVGIMALAVIENREMASALGINTTLSDRLTFAFGSALAGLAGVIIAPRLSVNAEMGLSWLANSFLAVIVGGVGTFVGTIAGGVLLGGLDNVFRSVLPDLTAVAQALVLVAALVIIRYRPNGLITPGGRE